MRLELFQIRGNILTKEREAYQHFLKCDLFCSAFSFEVITRCYNIQTSAFFPPAILSENANAPP